VPMCDAYIPAGALPEAAERALLSKVTDLLLLHEGVAPTNQAARALAWVFVHRHDMYVAGAPAGAPHYKFVCQVPEGQYDHERRAAVTKAMTEALVEAEGGRWPDPEARVWVFTFEVPDGTWGGDLRDGLGGRVVTLPDIAAHVVGDAGRRYGEQRLAERRREQARVLLEAAQG
jgi:phenylpyruvate tautomerase PptA (4-oxalocrotonate tautomerase family)